MSVSWSASETKTTVQRPNYVKAKLVELKPKAKKATQTRPTPNKVDLIKNQQMLQEQAKKAEQQRKAELQKKEAEEKRKKEEAQQRQIVEEKARKAKEAEEQRMLTQKQFEQALKEEEGQLMEDTYATEASSWQDVIAQRIERNWSRPQSARNGMRCEISLNLVPNGHVVNASIVKGSGDSAFDRSALAAVEKAQPFPEVKDIPTEVFERYFRKFTLVFSPMDRRL
jgi:colicin import membrane protein